jgi:hypothetical protein
MRAYFFIKYVRALLLLLALLICVWFFLSSDLFQKIRFQSKESMAIGYGDFQDTHIYPPPWFSSNATIYDYFKRKDRLKSVVDLEAIRRKHKMVIKNGFLNRERQSTIENRTFVIVEFTQVFKAPKFCGKTREIIFGKQCPYHNCE